MKLTPEVLEIRRQATLSILEVVDYHKRKHHDTFLSALNDLDRSRALCGEQTCDDIAREIERRMQR